MRILTDEELTIFFQKLKKYLGENVKFLIEDQEGQNEHMVFRILKNKVYYFSTTLLK